MPRGLVALSASAIAVVYAAGYMHTQSADAALGAADPTAQPATAQVQTAPAPTPTVVPFVAPRRDDAELGEGGFGERGEGRRQQFPGNPAVPNQRGVPAAPAQQPPAQQPPTQRTQPAPAPATSAGQAQSSGYKDGTYTGVGRSRRGDIQVKLTIQGGRIASVNITGATTEYPVRDIASLPGQVVSRQSAQVNLVSGATFSSMAFAQAVQQALSQAKTA